MKSEFVALVEDEDENEFSPELFAEVRKLMEETYDAEIKSSEDQKAHIDVKLPIELVEDLTAKLKAMGVALHPDPEAILMEPFSLDQMLYGSEL